MTDALTRAFPDCNGIGAAFSAPGPAMARVVSFEWGPTAARGLPGAIFSITTPGGEEVEVVHHQPQTPPLHVLFIADYRTTTVGSYTPLTPPTN